ncbi:receptor expression-enhancing protein 1 isoform X3 [Rhipicephalus sanguineus]|uniref:receptor expression-enhancing protein 1 isoform X3 n=1 Tax=Rhipicephalus sanguineus TaxID=34632 RepID=UPI001893E2BD|nr:receptor expression-enhancing protein 1 isoform X3 [Rhipicephalus sanguineus]
MHSTNWTSVRCEFGNPSKIQGQAKPNDKYRKGHNLLFGVLYPAYASYKAVKNKDVRSHLQWMMYWIVFALFTCIETFSDIFISFWMPFYYELKILFVLWLLSPATKGSSLLYRRFVHPQLVQREQDIDELIEKAKEQGYSTMLLLGSRGLSYATSVVLQTAIKAQEAIAAHKNRDVAAIQGIQDRPDGNALAWVDMDSDSEHLPELPAPCPLAPLVGTGDSLDIDNNVCAVNPGTHDEEICSSPRPVATKASRSSVKNRSRNTAKTTDSTGPTRRSVRAAKNASKN